MYPVMFGGDKPGQDKVTYLRTLILVGFPPVVVPLAHQNVRRYLKKESTLKDKTLNKTDVTLLAVSST